MSDAAQRTLLAVGGVPAIASHVGETVAEAPDPDESLSCEELPPHPEVTTTGNSLAARQQSSPSSPVAIMAWTQSLKGGTTSWPTTVSP